MSSESAAKVKFSGVVMMLLSVLLFLSLWFLNEQSLGEHSYFNKQIQFVKASTQLGDASDYLTAEARAFSVTKKMKHLDNFWREVNEVKRRDAAISLLQQMQGGKALLSLLEKSKANSDALIKTELTSMRLVLDVLKTPVADMPKAVADFKLPENLATMSEGDKMSHAQAILFDQQYYKDKRSIMQPLEQYQQLITKNMQKAAESQVHITKLIVLLSEILVIVLLLIGFNLLRLSKRL